jgi:tetratricopeptide (TPR) repeat protein
MRYIPTNTPNLIFLCLLLLLAACGSPKVVSESEATQPESSYAEMNWKKLKAAAEAEEAAGNDAQAAKLYRMAWDKKQNKYELLNKSAELYAGQNAYRESADAYQYLLTQNEDYPLVGLKYGRALKQDGQYDKAQRELARFLESYNEADRPIIEEIVNVELAGIELARAQAGKVSNLVLKRPEGGINTEANEYGPMPGEVGQLFFASDRGGQSRIYESRLQGRNWSNAVTPSGFPVIAEGEFGTGSISPDGERMYFTICSKGEEDTQRCEIFRSNRTPTGWGQPLPLSDQINEEGSNNANPHAAIVNGREVLYFSSNRTTGRGGMDIWYVARELGLNDGEFSLPVNLGPIINTSGDELAGYYDNEELSLYFSSNGHPSLGGLDVMKAAGQDINWSRPTNLGLPINSVADDYGFVIDRFGGGDAFLVSNRAFGGVKNNTSEADVFRVKLSDGQILLKASAYDNQSGTQLNNINVTLHQIYPDGTEERLVRKDFPAGTYLFELVPNQRFRVEVNRTGYQTASYTFTTNLEGINTYGQPLFLLPGTTTPSTTQPNNPYPTTNPERPTYPGAGTQPTTNPSMTQPTNPTANAGNAGTAVYDGRYYRVQISAEKSFDANAGKYQSVRAYGQIGAEPIAGRDLLRVTVGVYMTDAEAKDALSSIQAAGFPSAFTVRYDNGVRYGRVNL